MVVIGAGQMGKALSPLINRINYVLIAYGDNQNAGNYIGGIPVMSVEEAIGIAPDVAVVALANPERGKELVEQIHRLGFKGRVQGLWEFLEALDIRSAMTIRMAMRLKACGVEGKIAELGVYQGEFAGLLNRLFPDRTLYLFDTFEGFDVRDVAVEINEGYSGAKPSQFEETSVEMVLQQLPHKGKAVIRKGFFPETAKGIEGPFALVSLDADLYAPTLAGLEFFIPKMAKGGVIILHDYHNTRFSGVNMAIEDYEKKYDRLNLIPLCDLHGSAILSF